MKLRTPLVASASPLSRNVDDVKRLEEAGAAAVVFHSVFAEQLQSSAKAADFRVDPELYLNHIAQAKESVSIPVIGSVNAAAPAAGSAMFDGRASRASVGQRPRCRARRTAGALKARFIQRRLSTMDHRVVIAGGIPGRFANDRCFYGQRVFVGRASSMRFLFAWNTAQYSGDRPQT